MDLIFSELCPDRRPRERFNKSLHAVNKLSKWLCLAISVTGIFPVPVVAEPTLKMHIFAAPEAQQGTSVATSVQDKQGLKMIIFDAVTDNTRVISVQSERPVHPHFPPPKAVAKQQNTQPGRYWSAEISTGYVNQSLAWQIASPDGGVDPFLQAKWRQLDLWQIKADLGFHLPLGFVAKGHAAYAFTFAGDAQQNGYFANNSDPAYQLNSQADSGYAADFSGALGYQFDWGQSEESFVGGYFTPLAGYAYQEQKYIMRGGVESFAGQNTPQPAVHNDYLAEWSGPWVGFDAGLNLFKQHELFASFGYHWVDYRASGDWSNSAGLQHLEHSAKAHGYVTSVGYRFKPNSRWNFNVAFDYQHWDADKGSERLILSDGSFIDSSLAQVVRESFGVSVGVSVAF
ncbi:MAG: hypothetical protein P1P78_15070 [Methyloprofundus sp.]|nr:hypothetical protein [Methyloprofundus sp.]